MRKYICILLCLLLAGCSAPVPTATETTATISAPVLWCIDLDTLTHTAEEAVTVAEKTITIGCGGEYYLSGRLQNGQLVVDAEGQQVELVLQNAQLSTGDFAPLYVKAASSVIVTVADGTQNRLQVGQTDGEKVEAALLSETELLICGGGSLVVQNEQSHGISATGNITLSDLSLEVTSAGHSLRSENTITLLSGKLELNAQKDGIHCEGKEDATKGSFTMLGGEVTIRTEDDGISVADRLQIAGGKVHVLSCVEGLEAAHVYLQGGEVFVDASDDGINATIGSEIDCFNGEAMIHITGGDITVRTQGDGLDSNGDIRMDGGQVLVTGPGNTTHGFGALDYVNQAIITGGRFIALTSKGKSFSQGSTQPSFNLNLSRFGGNGQTVTMYQGNTVLFSHMAVCDINCVIVSLPELKLGETYTVTVGDKTHKISLTELITKSR